MNWTVFVASIVIVVGIFAIVAIGLDLQFSYSNLINFGVVGYAAVGAYAYAILTQPPPLDFDHYRISFNLSPALGLVGATLAGVAFAALTAWPALRLRGDFMAIMTLAFAEVVNILLVSEQWLTNGLLGFSRIRRPLQVSTRDAETLVLVGFVILSLVIVFLIVRRLVTHPFGNVLLAISDDELEAAAIGKNVERIRLQVFLVGGAIMGFAGALYAMYLTIVTPEVFPVDVTFVVWIALILGGVRTRFGPIIGVAILFGFQEATRFISLSPSQASFVSSLRLFLTGLLLIVVLRVRPPENVMAPMMRRRREKERQSREALPA